MNLYRAEFRVRPSPQHPNYWDLQFGILNLHLFDEDSESALRRATRIVEQLPYEIVGGPGTVREDTGEPVEPWLQIRREQTLIFGFDHYLLAWRVGEDEPEWMDPSWLKK